MPLALAGGSVVAIDSGGRRERVLAARNALVTEHLHLVPPIAALLKRRVPPSFELDDLIAAGNWGLLRAATRYRPKCHGNTPFGAFARPRIRGAILDSIRRKAWFEATMEEIPAGHTSVAHDPFAERTIADIDVSKTMAWGPYGKRRKRLAAAIGRLSVRERSVLGAYYAENVIAIDRAAAILGITEDQVESEHEAAIAKLRGWLKEA